MPVSNGQQANAATFNTTFLDKTQDDTTIGKLGLNAPASGAAITNAQQEINDIKDKFNPSTGHDHDGSDSKKIVATNLDSTGGSNGQVLKADGAGNVSWQNDISSGITIGSPESIAASGQITLLTGLHQVVKVLGDSGPQTASSTPFSSTPTTGTIIRVEGRDSTNTLTLVNNDAAGGCILNGDATLGKWDTLILRYDSTDDRFIEQGRNF